MTDKTGKLDSNKTSTDNVLSLPSTNESPLKFESFSSSKLHEVARSATAELSAALGGQEFTASVDEESLAAYEIVTALQVDVISNMAAQYTAEAIQSKYVVTDPSSMAKISLTIAHEGISDISNYTLNEVVDLKSRGEDIVASDERHAKTLAVTEMAIKVDHPQYAEFKATVEDIVQSGIGEKYELMSSSTSMAKTFIGIAKESGVENQVNIKRKEVKRAAADTTLVA